MHLGDEGQHLEFKRSVGAGTIKTIIAFANTDGGTIYIGVNDDGAVIGVEDVDAELTKLTNMIHDSIRPDIFMGISLDVKKLNERNVIVVQIARGVKRPYYLASKGPRPEGVFIRSGAASIPATETAILRMVQETEGDSFEARPSMRQDLAFDYARTAFARKGLALGEGELRTLGALQPDGTYTNLGLLLSDQCPPTVKAAVFADDSRLTFTAREEYAGSVLKQLTDAYAYVEQNNRYVTDYQGLERIDHHDIPPVALREALVNSVAHREYSLSGPTLVSCMPRGVEIVSPGGLPLGIEEADLGAHISIPRNKMLANVLFRLELIEAYGTGIGRIRSSYAESELEPEFRITPNTFTVFLPNRNARKGQRRAEGKSLIGSVHDLLAQGPQTRRAIQDALGMSQTAAIRLLAELVDEGMVEKLGSGRNTKYARASTK